jgi:hypothetical protein
MGEVIFKDYREFLEFLRERVNSDNTILSPYACISVEKFAGATYVFVQVVGLSLSAVTWERRLERNEDPETVIHNIKNALDMIPIDSYRCVVRED